MRNRIPLVKSTKQKYPPGSPGWWQSHPAPSEAANAQSRGRPQLPLERILAAAVALFDEVGAEGLGMRELAQRLGSGTATLYRHFQSKAEILAHVVDRILGEVEGDAQQLSKLTWQQGAALGATALFQVLRRHPNVGPLLLSQIPVGPNALAHRERAISFLLKNGFSARAAARAYSALMHYVLGFARQLRSSGSLHHTDGTQLRDFYRRLDKKTYPSIVAVADHLPRISDDEEFQSGLQLIIEGLGRSKAAG